MATRHLECGTRLYSIWEGMKGRCHRNKDGQYHLYGAKGIQVCSEWRHSFKSFREWALSHGYHESITLDRRDSTGDYCPDNCRWATYSQQAWNTRKRNKPSSSRYKGVHWSNRRKKWIAKIAIKYKEYALGAFESEEDAARAYNVRALKEFGEFATLNVPRT